MADEKQAYEGWAILELMGHRRIAGYVQQAEMYGAVLCQINIPGQNGDITATQFYGGSSIYCLTPTTEEVARAVALRNQPQPVQRWEMLPPAQSTVNQAVSSHEDVDYGDPDDDDQEYAHDL